MRKKTDQTFQFGLIGNPLKQSFSPELHRFFATYDYQLKPLTETELVPFIDAKKFRGINVTIPYKQTVIPYLDTIDPNAAQIGAVNTIVNRDGHLSGYNTDFMGLDSLLKRHQISLQNKKILILGTGGTSKTAFHLAKTQGGREIFRVSRAHPTTANSEFLEVNSIKENQSVSAFSRQNHLIDYQTATSQHQDAEIILNTTPCGMLGKSPGQMPISLEPFFQLEAVIDVIYNPLRTQLILEAEKREIKTCNGLYMLVAQAFSASELFQNKKLDPELEEVAYQTLSAQKMNLVLIGMPSSGKSTIGKLLATRNGRDFIDTDQLINEKFGRSPAEIINNEGEPVFRQMEKAVILGLRDRSGVVIATGGGSILDTENVDALKANGKLFFLDRRLQELMPSGSRPLSANREALAKCFETRYPIYLRTADVVVNNNQPLQEIAAQIEQMFFP